MLIVFHSRKRGNCLFKEAPFANIDISLGQAKRLDIDINVPFTRNSGLMPSKKQKKTMNEKKNCDIANSMKDS